MEPRTANHPSTDQDPVAASTPLPDTSRTTVSDLVPRSCVEHTQTFWQDLAADSLWEAFEVVTIVNDVIRRGSEALANMKEEVAELSELRFGLADARIRLTKHLDRLHEFRVDADIDSLTYVEDRARREFQTS